MHPPKPTKRLPHTLSYAKILRTSQTPMEKILWKKIRNHHFHNLKFRRQVPIGPYIVDFYCAEKNLIIEVDGGVHALQETYDHHREQYLQKHGYSVVRITNSFVKEWLPEALEKIGRMAGIDYES